MFEIYIGALLSATFAISIFSEYIENGTELIIMSKPLTRLQITLCKFLVLVTTVIFYTLFNSSVVLLVYYFTDCTTYECLNLLCSLLMSTFTFLLLFGSFAVLCSMYVGKV
jgi:ABC-2 type transport system permease protein